MTQKRLSIQADVIKKEQKKWKKQAQTAWGWTEKALRCSVEGGWNEVQTSKGKTSRVQFVARQ